MRLLSVSAITMSLAMSGGRATAQQPVARSGCCADLILLAEEVVVAKAIEVRQSGTLRVQFNDTEAELRLDSIRLAGRGSSVREKADELLRQRLLGKSVEVHIRRSDRREHAWIGYALHDGVDVRLELVTKGLARYCQGNLRETEFERADQKARASRQGMWRERYRKAVPRCEGAA